MTNSEETNEQMLLQMRLMQEQLRAMEVSCKRMDTHINFIENVYNTLKAPLNWVLLQWQRVALVPHRMLHSLPNTPGVCRMVK